MSLTRPLSTLRASRLLSLRTPLQTQLRFATSDYGSGKGHPAGETPQKQGQNPSENVEHPGPPPPGVAQGKSSSSPNTESKEKQSGSQTQTDAKSSSSNGSQKRGFSTFSRRLADKKEPAVNSAQKQKPSKEAMENAQPKILNENPPAGKEQSGDVKRHNEEMENRAEQAHEKAGNEDAPGDKERVPKEFWKG